jgi:hypothetical protein
VPGYKIHLSINTKNDKNDLEYPRGKVA